nr:methyltransferase domain-containing protein [uncultured Holophaga sp.]
MDAIETGEYNRIALGPNAPLYAFYAERILESTGISEGVCLDVGCGGGYLGMAMAAITELDFIFLDQCEAMLGHLERNLAGQGLGGRSVILQAQVQAIPLPAGSVDLVISRGSVPFWEELPRAFTELYRILRPGGRAYIGGGLGPATMRAQVEAALRLEEPRWSKKDRGRRTPGEYEEALRTAGIPGATVSRSEIGTWIEFGKE